LDYKQFGKRAAVSVVGIPLITSAVLLGKLYFVALMSLITGVALWEFYAFARAKKYYPSRIIGVLSIVAINLALYYRKEIDIQWLILAIPWLVLLLELFRRKEHALVNVSITLGGIAYLSLFSTFILIREAPVDPDNYMAGGLLVMLVLAIIWICDTAAYLFGIRFGRNPLFKRISPHKTWEGSIAGFMVSIITAVLLGHYMSPYMSIMQRGFLGMLIGIVGQVSDLVESQFKRDARVKDSSQLIPGHGGMLDRFDSPILTGPAVLLFLYLSVLS
jgi:phosphatidate cytidylyltransferase